MIQLDRIFESLEKAIEIENQSRRFDELDESELIGRTEIRIMGQMSLLTNDTVHRQIKLVGTLDVDAAVDGGYYGWVGKKFDELLRAQNLELDQYADEIWLPKGASFDEIFSSKHLSCLRLNHLDALVSKAVKAKVKNRLLIQQALVAYPDLRELLRKNNVNAAYFEDEE